ncbi:hypothetical protein CEXT_162821 [Caerostris extrusa]|uniref:Uncharacterized protein n=1 Tax=Caerostris extrusa TaxID=172846 RepID=A0AAV4U7W8_CAEEX|nr:hypothetical protein CEXT_162821 [Caerostris extrusa]
MFIIFATRRHRWPFVAAAPTPIHRGMRSQFRNAFGGVPRDKSHLSPPVFPSLTVAETAEEGLRYSPGD